MTPLSPQARRRAGHGFVRDGSAVEAVAKQRVVLLERADVGTI
jgi:hypothetical protein